MRRSSPAGMGRPCVCGATALEIDPDRDRCRIGERRASRRRRDRDRRRQRGGNRRRGPARSRRRSARRSPRSWLGGRAAAARGSGQRRHRPRTPRGPESSAPRASASAGPSTCSSAPTAKSSSARCSSPGSWPAGTAAEGSRPALTQPDVRPSARRGWRAPAQATSSRSSRAMERAAGDDPAARSADARVHRRGALRARARRTPSASGDAEADRARSDRIADRPRPRRDESDAGNSRRPAGPARWPGSTRCRCARWSRPRSRCPPAATLPEVEIMLPLIAFEASSCALRELVDGAVERRLETAEPHRGRVGTMIELPGACLAAGAIAAHADFFSFGTNDLTQTALGLSRDDAERGFLPGYIAARLVARSPFETIDADRGRGAGQDRRRARPRDQAWAELGRLRRARRRPGQHRVLPRRRPRLRQLLPVPGADRAGRGGPGGAVRAERPRPGTERFG